VGRRLETPKHGRLQSILNKILHAFLVCFYKCY